MEKEIRPGIFISVVTKQQRLNRAKTLSGDDLQVFIGKCNSFWMAHDSMKHYLGVTKAELIEVCKELEPDLNLNEDSFVIRYAPEVDHSG